MLGTEMKSRRHENASFLMRHHFNQIFLGAFQMPLLSLHSLFQEKLLSYRVTFTPVFLPQLLSIGVPSLTLKWTFKQERHLRFLQAAPLLLLMDTWTLLEEIASAWVNCPMSTGQKPLREQGIDCIVILKIEHSTLSFIQLYFSVQIISVFVCVKRIKVILKIQNM